MDIRRIIIETNISLNKYQSIFSRSIEEKSIWRQENTSNEWKLDNLILLKSRLTGWQLTSFEKSYEFKIKNGMSLIKYNLSKNEKN